MPYTRTAQQGPRARASASPAANDIWGERTPLSDPILVVSGKVPDLRYLGHAYNRDFHVVFEHLARATMSENTQLYRNLRLHILPGWEIWRESLKFAQGEFLQEMLTFSGARSFLSALGDCSLPPEARARVERVSAAFVDSMPEGTLYIIPEGTAYDPRERRVPALPLRAICRDRLIYPLLVRGSESWLALWYLCRWYRLPYGGLRRFLYTAAGRRFETHEWIVPGVGRQAQFYVPLSQAPDFLLALAGYWRAMNARCWQRVIFLGNALDNGACAEQAWQEEQADARSLPLRAERAPGKVSHTWSNGGQGQYGGQYGGKSSGSMAQATGQHVEASGRPCANGRGTQCSPARDSAPAGQAACVQQAGQNGHEGAATCACQYQAREQGQDQHQHQHQARVQAGRPTGSQVDRPGGSEAGLWQRQLESLVTSMRFLERSIQELTARLSRMEGEKRAVEVEARPVSSARQLPALLEHGSRPIPG